MIPKYYILESILNPRPISISQMPKYYKDQKVSKIELITPYQEGVKKAENCEEISSARRQISFFQVCCSNSNSTPNEVELKCDWLKRFQDPYISKGSNEPPSVVVLKVCHEAIEFEDSRNDVIELLQILIFPNPELLAADR